MDKSTRPPWPVSSGWPTRAANSTTCSRSCRRSSCSTRWWPRMAGCC